MKYVTDIQWQNFLVPNVIACTKVSLSDIATSGNWWPLWPTLARLWVWFGSPSLAAMRWWPSSHSALQPDSTDQLIRDTWWVFTDFIVFNLVSQRNKSLLSLAFAVNLFYADICFDELNLLSSDQRHGSFPQLRWYHDGHVQYGCKCHGIRHANGHRVHHRRKRKREQTRKQ